MASLADIRARLKAQEDKKSGNFSNTDSPVYPHWNIQEGDTAILRFLEDGNTENPYFWVERLMFRLPFNGVKGDPTQNGTVIVQVPCMEMYGEQDKVLNEVRAWFKDPNLEDMGRKYWKKRSYIFQGFVRQDPMPDSGNPESPIRRFMISPQIFTLIKNSLLDPEIEYLPTDPLHGLDFRVTKGSKGGYADYSNSSWARKESELTEEELTAIEEHGLWNLSDFLPTKPTPEAQNIIFEMFEASVNGEAYDKEKWGAYYTPPGMSRDDSNNASTAEAKPTAQAETKAPVEAAKPAAEAKPAEAPAPEAAVVKEDPPFETEESTDKAKDILAMIKARQNQ